MSSSEKTKRSSICVNASSLISLFNSTPDLLGVAEQVSEDQVPSPYRELLAHTNHMTVTVEQYHDDSVDVEVLQSRTSDYQYVREILLLTQKSRIVVQYGIVRLDTRFLPAAPRDEILSQKKPLGRVLIEHDVLRNIELFDLIRFECGSKLAEHFDVPEGTETYGRTAMLYCNREPAIELLEIVRPV